MIVSTFRGNDPAKQPGQTAHLSRQPEIAAEEVAGYSSEMLNNSIGFAQDVGDTSGALTLIGAVVQLVAVYTGALKRPCLLEK